MRLLLGIVLALLSPTLFAATMLTRVADIRPSHSPHEETLVFLSTGTVAKVSPGERALIEELELSRRRGKWLTMELDQDRFIRSALVTEVAEDENPKQLHVTGEYFPSIIPSPEESARLFLDGRLKHKESQCYNRAHIWSYEWRVKEQVFSSKIWIFFTAKYIRKYNFEWWFHVAPLFHVLLDDGKVHERVADVKYVRAPVKVKTWTDTFLRNDPECPVVERYSDYADYQESSWCYVMKSPMYYYQPLDLEQLEKDGTERLLWNPAEIRQAYKEAFDIEL